MKTLVRFSLSGFVFAVALLCSPDVKAQFFSFNVDLNTAPLSGDPFPPFALDFQLNQGSGSLPSTVTLSNFQFAGGSATGSPKLTGTASGNLGSSVSLNDSTNPFNEFFQGFTAGTTDIKFTATVSQNFTGLTPAGFNVAVLDNATGSLAQLWTNAPDAASLVTLDLGASNTLGDVGAYSSVSPSPVGVTATVTAIPEPSTTAVLMGVGVMALALRRSRRTKAQVAA